MIPWSWLRTGLRSCYERAWDDAGKIHCESNSAVYGNVNLLTCTVQEQIGC